MRRVDAWPFAIAAGRHREFTSILTPDFLVASPGLLTDAVSLRPGTDPCVTSLAKGALSVAYRVAVVSHGEVGLPGDAAAPVRDDASRPLRIAFGFAVRDDEILEVGEADLAFVRHLAFSCYADFLAAESSSTTVASAPFALAASTTSGAAQRAPTPSRAAVSGAAVSGAAVSSAAVSGAAPSRAFAPAAGAAARPAPGPARGPARGPATAGAAPPARIKGDRPATTGVAVAVVGVLAAGVAAAFWLTGGGSETPPCDPVVTPTVTLANGTVFRPTVITPTAEDCR